MDKRLKTPFPVEVSLQQREQFYQDLAAGKLELATAVATMRKLSRLTQPEFAQHRGISVQALKQIEAGKGNPTMAH